MIRFLSHTAPGSPPEKLPLDCPRCEEPLFSEVCDAGCTDGRRGEDSCEECDGTGHRVSCAVCQYDATVPENSPPWLDTEPVSLTARFLNVSPTVAAEIVALAAEERLEILIPEHLDLAWNLYSRR